MINYTIIDNSTITSSISDNAYRIYNLLLSMAYGTKISCYPSQATISEKLHKSVRTVARGVKELKDKGLISIRRRGSISNVYTMLKKAVSTTVNKVKSTVNKVVKKSYPSKKKNNLFNNFKQREYNFSNLEDMLLGKSDYDEERLIE